MAEKSKTENLFMLSEASKKSLIRARAVCPGSSNFLYMAYKKYMFEMVNTLFYYGTDVY